MWSSNETIVDVFWIIGWEWNQPGPSAGREVGVSYRVGNLELCYHTVGRPFGGYDGGVFQAFAGFSGENWGSDVTNQPYASGFTRTLVSMRGFCHVCFDLLLINCFVSTG